MEDLFSHLIIITSPSSLHFTSKLRTYLLHSKKLTPCEGFSPILHLPPIFLEPLRQAMAQIIPPPVTFVSSNFIVQFLLNDKPTVAEPKPRPINLQNILATASEFIQEQNQWNTILVDFFRNEIDLKGMLSVLMKTWIRNPFLQTEPTVEDLCEIYTNADLHHVANKLSAKFPQTGLRVRDNFRLSNEVMNHRVLIPARVEFPDEDVREITLLLESNKIAMDLTQAFLQQQVKKTFFSRLPYRVSKFYDDFAVFKRKLQDIRGTPLIPPHDTIMEIILDELNDFAYVKPAKTILALLFLTNPSRILMGDMFQLFNFFYKDASTLETQGYFWCIRHLHFFFLIYVEEDGNLTITDLARQYILSKFSKGELMTDVTFVSIAWAILDLIPQQINKRTRLNLALFNQCLAISINLLKIRHSEVNEVFFSLTLKIAEILLAMERHQDTLDLCSPAYTLLQKWRETGWKENAREEHTIMAYMGISLKITGRIAEAKSYLSTSWEYWKDRYQTKYAKAFILSGHGIAQIINDQGDCNRSLVIYSELLDDDHLDLLPLHKEITRVYYYIGEIYEQLQHTYSTYFFAKALIRAKLAYGPEHETTLLVMEKLGLSFLYISNEYDKALNTFTELIDTWKNIEPSPSKGTIQTASNIGMCFLQMRNFPQALEIFKRILPTAQNTFGEDSVLVKDIKESIKSAKCFAVSTISAMELQSTL